MKIKDILSRKGSDVITVTPDETVSNLVNLLSVKNIGAAIVTSDGETVLGVVSERDVVRHLASDGPTVLDKPVSEIMTIDIVACSPYDIVEGVAHVMTTHRFRHMPVVKKDSLIGVVSIGDVVKHRIDRLMDERNHLLEYLHK